MKALDLTGVRFSRLTCKYFVGNLYSGHRYWLCVCDCGKEVTASVGNLTSNQIKSCGCFNKELVIKRATKHGLANNSPEYPSWKNMRNRCNNPQHKRYQDYGGRGIKVCNRWSDFSLFLLDMGPKPFKGASVERKNNSKGYSPSNCIWATPRIQARNKRNNRRVTYKGKTHCLIEWAEITGICRHTLAKRLDAGYVLSKVFKK